MTMTTDPIAHIVELVGTMSKLDLDTWEAVRTPEIERIATEWLESYTGDFEFLLDVQARASRGVSSGQLKGVTNCMLAEARKRAAQADTAAEPKVEPGRYAVTLGGKLRFFKLGQAREGYTNGWLAEEFGGDHHEPIRGRKARVEILTAIANDPDALARYGQELGVCGVCGRTLTDETSRALGIGPVCRGE